MHTHRIEELKECIHFHVRCIIFPDANSSQRERELFERHLPIPVIGHLPLPHDLRDTDLLFGKQLSPPASNEWREGVGEGATWSTMEELELGVEVNLLLLHPLGGELGQ